jgi:hypothetical protein
MPQFMVSFAASIKAEDEDEAKSIAMEMMRDPDPWSFHEHFGCVIEIDEEESN